MDQHEIDALKRKLRSAADDFKTETNGLVANLDVGNVTKDQMLEYNRQVFYYIHTISESLIEALEKIIS